MSVRRRLVLKCSQFILALSLVGLVASIRAPASEVESFDILALGCHFPIPAEYLLNTRERSHFAFFDPRPFSSGRITISDGTGELPAGEYEVLSRKAFGHVTLIEARYVGDSIDRPLDDSVRNLTMISGESQHATFYGEARAQAEDTAAYCAAHPDS